MWIWARPVPEGVGLAVDAAARHGLLPGTCVPPLEPFETEGMAMTIVESARPVTGGVDTHADVHVAAAVDGNGGVLGVESFPTTPAGYVQLHGWLAGFGPVARVGVEGTGAYGAGLARHLRGRGLVVIEVDAWFWRCG